MYVLYERVRVYTNSHMYVLYERVRVLHNSHTYVLCERLRVYTNSHTYALYERVRLYKPLTRVFYMNACEYAFCILALVHIRKIKTTRVRVIERLCRISVLLKAEPEEFALPQAVLQIRLVVVMF